MSLKLFTQSLLGKWTSPLLPGRQVAAAFHTSLIHQQAATSTTTTEPTWSPNSIRTGVIAKKKGMTSTWTAEGVRIPVTILQLEDVIVTDVRNDNKHGYTALQVGCSPLKEKSASKPMKEHFNKLGVPLRQKLLEFRVSNDAVLPIGTPLKANHYIVGQYVDVTAPSIGKGFAGVMKRWNFGGLPASHGHSLSHRSAGSTGQRKWPSKVFKGKKMAGRLGGESVTVQNLEVIKVDTELDLLYIKGSVPGFDDQFVKIKDAVKKKGDKLFPKDSAPPPFPTAIQQ
ncbi:translation protein [Halteromyces radiatus]|uniref:translation protein n=1 Tax=Halteromyces radiatus TaxID=101107 RepID=UPI0022201A4D|nr:translation protein [Halteromyces radiatus]KAI8081473.1 translation protein [Halteromyces radiatus]